MSEHENKDMKLQVAAVAKNVQSQNTPAPTSRLKSDGRVFAAVFESPSPHFLIINHVLRIDRTLNRTVARRVNGFPLICILYYYLADCVLPMSLRRFTEAW